MAQLKQKQWFLVCDLMILVLKWPLVKFYLVLAVQLSFFSSVLTMVPKIMAMNTSIYLTTYHFVHKIWNEENVKNRCLIMLYTKQCVVFANKYVCVFRRVFVCLCAYIYI